MKLVYICAILIVIVLGISSRAYADHLPLFISRHAGDALWGSMVYLGFRVLLTKHKSLLSLVLGLLFSFGIEFSQLYQGQWINGIRSTVLGGLILGKGFLWIDLIRYSAGIGITFVLEYFLLLLVLQTDPIEMIPGQNKTDYSGGKKDN